LCIAGYNYTVSNNNTEAVLKSLESLYLEGNMAGALELSVKENNQFSPGHLYYNLGTIYAKTGDYAQGRYYMERAFKEGFDLPKVAHNLEIIKSNLTVRELGEAGGVFGSTFSYMLGVAPAYYTGLSLMLAILVLLLVRLKFFKKISLIVLFLLLSLAPLGFSKFYLSKMDFGIALEEIKIYEGPSNIYSSIGALNPGQKIIVGQKDKDWVFIKYPESFRGWVAGKKLGLF